MKSHFLAAVAALLLAATLFSCSAPTEEQGTTLPPFESDSETDAPDDEEEGMQFEEIEYYKNPLMTAETDNAWPSYGFGDPFVMRHNGKYYLYVSTKDGSLGIKCWTSDDLVDWTYEGFCTRDKITMGSYAPEVYYYNGYFYMYTSPGGYGHYVLRSESPTEGFEPITGNMGMSIDGSIFIDNDGKWYFYTAGQGAMRVYDMSSPSDMYNGRPMYAVSVNGGWTEGAMTVYHDGYYYITYTGNHVLSPSYRIYCASSATSPVEFTRGDDPLLINTSDEVFGIGHSSTVKGPDLDSYYIVYHSLVTALPNRDVNIDRIVFDEGRATVLGPTVASRQKPSMPDVYHHFESGSSLKGWKLNGEFGSGKAGITIKGGSTLISDHVFDGDLTAEYNLLSISEGARAGALFMYTDEENYGKCLFDPASQKLTVTLCSNGESETYEFDTVRSFDEAVRGDALQSLQIERSGSTLTLYMNDRLFGTIEDVKLGGGRIGYITEGGEASFGFIGGTGAVGGRGSADEFKHVSDISGLIPATEYAEGEFETVPSERGTAVKAKAGDSLSYYIAAALNGDYDLSARYSASGNAKIEMLVDGKSAAEFTLDGSGAAVLRGIPLTKGQHLITFTLKEGEAEFIDFTLLRGAETKELDIAYDKLGDGREYSDGHWSITEDGITADNSSSTGKRLYGSKNMGDYTVSVNVSAKMNVNCGLVLRATDPGAPTFLEHNEDEYDAEIGTDWLIGYFAGIDNGGVILGKQSYGYTELARKDVEIVSGQFYELKAVCKGATIEVYLDGELCISYTDPDPYIQGMVGIRTLYSRAAFNSFKLTK